MATIKLSRIDLYSNGNILEFNTNEAMLVRDPRSYVESEKDRIYTTVMGDTWDSIAFNFYGNSKYWHFIADVNNVFNPLEELEVGMEVLIPDIDNY